VTTAGSARRWPLHPPPAPGESLTSWLGRLARLYCAVPRDLLRDALGEGQALLDDPRAADLDFDPPPEILRALAARVSADFGAVRMTTIVGWTPWLAGTLDPAAGQDAFDDYARRQPVILAPGEAGRSDVPRWLPWMPAAGLADLSPGGGE
jgi:TniQ